MNIVGMSLILYGIFFASCVHADFFRSPELISTIESDETPLSFDIDFGGSESNSLAGITWQVRLSSGSEKVRTYLMLNETFSSQEWHGEDNTVFGSSPFRIVQSGKKIKAVSAADSNRLALNHQDFTSEGGTTGNWITFQGGSDPTGSFNYKVINGISSIEACNRFDGAYNNNQYPVVAIGTTALSFAAFAIDVLSKGLESGANIETRLHPSDEFSSETNCNWGRVDNIGTGRKNIAEDLCGAMSFKGQAANTGGLVWKQRIKNDGILDRLKDEIEDCFEDGICELSVASDSEGEFNPRGHTKGTIRALDNVLGEWQNILPLSILPFGARDKRLPGTLLSSPLKPKDDDDRGPIILVDNFQGSGIAIWARHSDRNNNVSLKASYRLPIFGSTLSTNTRAFRWKPEFNFSPLVSDGENILFKGVTAPGRAGTTLVVYTITKGSNTTLYFHLFPLAAFFNADGATPSGVQIPRVAFENLIDVSFLDLAIDDNGHAVATWIEQDSIKTSIFLINEELWMEPEIIPSPLLKITNSPRVKMSLGGNAFIAFIESDGTTGTGLMSTFNQLLPISMNNIDTQLITHSFGEREPAQDPTISPSCEQMLNMASSVQVEQRFNRTASQGSCSNRVSWDPVPGASSYLVERNGIPIATIAGTETTYVDHNKSPSIPYQYSVVAFNSNGSPYCNKLTWDKMIGVTGYQIERLDQSGIIATVDKDTTTFTDCETTQVNDGSCDNCPSPAQCVYLIKGLRPIEVPDCTVLFWDPVRDGTVSGYNIYRSARVNEGICCLLGTINNPNRFEFVDCSSSSFVPGCLQSDEYTVSLIQAGSGCDRCNRISWTKPDTTLNIVGYNIYKEGKKIGVSFCNRSQCTPTVSGADTTEYIDCDLGTGRDSLRYFVVAVIQEADGTFLETFPSNGRIARPVCSRIFNESCPAA